ncbi:MAG: hypothetical protein ACQEQC_02560 [Elusimicrobiota bacterium]
MKYFKYIVIIISFLAAGAVDKGFTSDEVLDYKLEIEVYHKGGNGALINFPVGGNMLIDTGSSPEIIDNITQNIYKKDKYYKFMGTLGWTPRIDWLIISNLSSNRIANIRDVLRSFDIKKIYSSTNIRKLYEDDTIVTQSVVSDLLYELGLKGQSIRLLSDGDNIKFHQGMENLACKILYPPEPAESHRDSNICMKIKYNRVEIMYISELTEMQQNQLINSKGEQLTADILIHPIGISSEFLGKVGAENYITTGENKKIITDGHRITITTLRSNNE